MASKSFYGRDKGKNPGEEMLAVRSKRKLIQQNLGAIERRLEYLRKEETQYRHKEELYHKTYERREHIHQLHKDKQDFLLMWRTMKQKEHKDLKLRILEARMTQREKIYESREQLQNQRKVSATQLRAVELKEDSLHLRKQSMSVDYADYSRRSSKAKLIAHEFSSFKEQRKFEELRRRQELNQLYSSKINSERSLIEKMEVKINELKELEQRLIDEFRATPRLIQGNDSFRLPDIQILEEV